MATDPAPLIAGLLRPEAFPHPAPHPQLIETHISWVILAGEHAYKIKKPIQLDFLDFSSLAKREHFCREEVRLNRRLASDIYIDVVPITGSLGVPRIGGPGEVLEWAVHMRAFDPQTCLDQAASVKREQIVTIAREIAEFHSALVPIGKPSEAVEQSTRPALNNFRELRSLLAGHNDLLVRLQNLEAWTQCESLRLKPFFESRQGLGHVRECHGDLHLGNIAWHNDHALIFDALEFDEKLRCTDTLSECAFLMMDLAFHAQPHQAWRFINEYLEHSGDYLSLPGLKYYLVYRAMVRTKVNAIRLSQNSPKVSSIRAYVDLAENVMQPGNAGLILMHGLSGSGKSYLSGELMERLGAIRLRSDVERKRLFGLTAEQPSTNLKTDIYTPEASQRTRRHLLEMTRNLLVEHIPVIVDATFIARNWRNPFTTLADKLGVRWCIVSLEMPEMLIRQRLRRRAQQGTGISEANENVLDLQLAHNEPLSALEQAHKFRVTDGDEACTLAHSICESLSLRALF